MEVKIFFKYLSRYVSVRKLHAYNNIIAFDAFNVVTRKHTFSFVESCLKTDSVLINTLIIVDCFLLSSLYTQYYYLMYCDTEPSLQNSKQIVFVFMLLRVFFSLFCIVNV